MVWWFLPLIVGGLVGGATGFVVSAIIDAVTEDNARDEIKLKYPSAFKARLKSKETKRVYFDVFNQDSKVIANDFVIESEKGVSASLEVGTEIYL
jgi:hypothetical protein